eukprot:1471270-Rhodomonas_salina.1
MSGSRSNASAADRTCVFQRYLAHVIVDHNAAFGGACPRDRFEVTWCRPDLARHVACHVTAALACQGCPDAAMDRGLRLQVTDHDAQADSALF